MLTVKEMQALSRKLPLDKFCQQLGPFALIQRPLGEVAGLDDLDLPMRAARTRIAELEAVKSGAMELIRDFAALSVATLPPMSGNDELLVGRLPNCDLVVDHPSVSKRHAVLRWDATKKQCSVKDLGSTNGTRIDSDMAVRGETPLRDGDVVTFGEAHFWYLLTATLHAKLSQT